MQKAKLNQVACNRIYIHLMARQCSLIVEITWLKKIDGNRFHSWMAHSTHTGVFISANANIECHRKWITVKHFIRHERYTESRTVYDGPVQIFAHNLDPIVIQQDSAFYIYNARASWLMVCKRRHTFPYETNEANIRVPTHRCPSEVEN